MTTKAQLLIYVILLGVFDAVILFFPVLAVALVYILLAKPIWFLDMVQEIYKSN